MSILSRLFGGGGGAAKEAATPEEYDGFAITPEPIREGSNYRVAALIEKDGKTHNLVRADTMTDRDEAVRISLLKARQMIDEQGDALFN